MSPKQDRAGARNRERTTAGHLDALDTKPVLRTPMDAAISSVVPSGNRRAILAIFENRITWGAIRHWRKGRRTPPQWARKLIAEHLAHGARRYAQPLEALQSLPVSIGYVDNIAACRASQMEKAGK